MKIIDDRMYPEPLNNEVIPVLKCFFLRILHQILKLNLCTWHTVTANIFLE